MPRQLLSQPVQSRGPYLMSWGARLAWAFAISILLLVALFYAVRMDYDSSYAMPPYQYYAQADGIKPGMTRQEVLAKIRGASEVTKESDEVTFAMKPQRRNALAGVTHYISVHFDKNGRVAKVTVNDG